MALPYSIAAQTSNIPGSYFDSNNAALGAMGTLACTCSGTNTIALTQAANQPVISAYANYQLFGFVAANTSTGSVTVSANAIGALNLYLQDGATQAGAGSIQNNVFYVIAYNSALNSNAGGFQIVSVCPSVVTVKRQLFVASGTYTPTAGMLYCDMEVWGAGGGGGGVGTTTNIAGGGGGSGGYAKKVVSASTVGASQTVTIGAGGTAGANTGGTGGTGGTSSIGSIVSATGGVGGVGNTGTGPAAGGTAGAGTAGDIQSTGFPGGFGIGGTTAYSGFGGGPGGGVGIVVGNNSAGTNGIANSGGGGGGAINSASTGRAGGVGGSGYAVVTEYCLK